MSYGRRLRTLGVLAERGVLQASDAATRPARAMAQNLVGMGAYFAYFWTSRGASIGMMLFGFNVRDVATGQYPTMGKAALRGFSWTFEVGFTICIIGAIGWLWQLWDSEKQAIHDKVAGTIVTTT